MRLVFIGLSTTVAILAASVQPGSAQFSFFNDHFCTQGGGLDSSGEPDCSYRTLAQCRATASGLGRYCTENPNWKPPQGERSRRTGRRHEQD
jgi:hypothetical protein